MKFFKFIFCFLVLFCVQAEATYIPFNCALTVGARCYSSAELARFESGTTGVILYGNVPTDGRITTLRTSNTASGYQVGSGKTLTIKSVSYVGGAGGRVIVGYGDTDVGLNSGSAPTNPVVVGGATTVSSGFSYLSGNTSAAGINTGAAYINFTAPQNKYPFIYAEGAGFSNVIVYAFID
jgi:hypothetical protein